MTNDPPRAGGGVRLDGTLVLASRGQALSLTWALLLWLASISHCGRCRILFWPFSEGTLKDGRHSEAEKQKHSFRLSLPRSWFLTALMRLREEHILVKSKQISCPVEKLRLRQGSWCESVRKTWQICERLAAGTLYEPEVFSSPCISQWSSVCSLAMSELHRGSDQLPHFTETDVMAEKWNGFCDFTQCRVGTQIQVSHLPDFIAPTQIANHHN